MTLPFYPFYWGDYSSKTFNLTNTQHGIYILLLRNIYTGGEPMDTVEQCYSIAKATPEQERDVDLILLRFFTKEKGFWVNKKALSVIKEWERKHQAHVNKGKKGGRPAKVELKSSLSPTKVGPKQPEPEPEPEPEPNKIRKKEPTVLSKEKRGTRIPENFEPDASCHQLAEKLLLTNQDCQGALENFMDYWRAVPAAKGVKLDWQATFRNQLRHISKQKGKPNGTHSTPRPNTMADGFAKVRAVIAEAERRENASSGTASEENVISIPRLRQITP